MAEKFNDNSSKARSGEDDARAELAGNWAQMAASMVSPNAQQGPRKGANGGGPAPLPVSALPVPDDEPEAPPDRPQHFDLPRNAKGELTPAQRARLGLDLDPSSDDPAAQSAALAPSAPPAGQPLQPPSQRPAPRAQPQDTVQPVPDDAPAARPATPMRPVTPAANAPPVEHAVPEPAVAASGGSQPAESEFDFRALDPEPELLEPAPALRPVESEPRLAPVSGEPRLAPARETVAPSERGARARGGVPAAKETQRRDRDDERDDEDEFQRVARDRNVLSYGVAWTAFAVVVTAIIGFTTSMSGDPTASAGPGPLMPGLMSIAMGWIVVVAARTMGKGWWSLMVLPALVLFIGPYFYKTYWAGSVEDAARSYLSNNGAGVQVDMDATSVVSQTVNTPRGCFSINRTRANYDTEIDVVTYQPETARQQADFSLAPRYAGRIQAGGDRATARIFTYKNGRAPAIVTTPTQPPLDCTNSTTAPGTGAKVVDQG